MKLSCPGKSNAAPLPTAKSAGMKTTAAHSRDSVGMLLCSAGLAASLHMAGAMKSEVPSPLAVQALIAPFNLKPHQARQRHPPLQQPLPVTSQLPRRAQPRPLLPLRQQPRALRHTSPSMSHRYWLTCTLPQVDHSGPPTPTGFRETHVQMRGMVLSATYQRPTRLCCECSACFSYTALACLAHHNAVLHCPAITRSFPVCSLHLLQGATTAE